MEYWKHDKSCHSPSINLPSLLRANTISNNSHISSSPQSRNTLYHNHHIQSKRETEYWCPRWRYLAKHTYNTRIGHPSYSSNRTASPVTADADSFHHRSRRTYQPIWWPIPYMLGTPINHLYNNASKPRRAAINLYYPHPDVRVMRQDHTIIIVQQVLLTSRFTPGQRWTQTSCGIIYM